MRTGFFRGITAAALLLGFAANSAAQDKSWEIDIYGDDVEITYVPDGRNDIHIYDQLRPWNDRSYIELDYPRYWHRHRYFGGYGRRDDWGYYDRPYRYDRWYRPRYRVEYHHRYRGW